MKTLKHKLLLLLMGTVSAASAQKMNVSVGYNIGSHLKMGGLDFVIQRYNETRTAFLTTKMKSPSFFRGMNYAVEVFYPRAMMDFEWVSRKSDVFAEASGSKQRRDFRCKMNSFNMGYGYKLSKNRANAMGWYLGLDFSTISIKNYTRAYQSDPGIEKPEYDKINWDLVVGFSPFLQLTGNRFTTKIYCQFMSLKADYWDVNVAINPYTWSGDDFDSNQGKAISLGICLRYNLIRQGPK